MKKMKVIVAGSRSFRDYEVLCKTLDEMEITTIISGGARGADRLGERYAKERGISLEQYPAQWKSREKPTTGKLIITMGITSAIPPIQATQV